MSWLDTIKEYWGMILFVAGLIFHAIWTYFRVGEHDKRIARLEDKQEESDVAHSEFAQMVESVKTEIATMNAKLDILLDGYKKK